MRFWGVRGSFPSVLPSCRLLGGNTSCLELEWQGHHLIVDAGTGIRKLGERLIEHPSQHPIHLLISHPHWDHIQGFPFFAPAYSPEVQLQVHSLRRSSKIRSLLAAQQQQAFFSTPLDEMQSELRFHEWEESETFSAGPFRVETWRLNHPGVCSGFRIQVGPDFVVAYVSDVAPSTDYLLAESLPGRPGREEALQQLQDNQFRLADRADVVIYDTFFTPDQYLQRSHWGHSTLDHAAAICSNSGARNLFMFHHNSELTDLEQMERVRSFQAPEGLAIHLAKEGDRFELQPGELRPCE